MIRISIRQVTEKSLSDYEICQESNQKAVLFGALFILSPDHRSLEGHGKELRFGSKNVGKLLEACEQGRDVIQFNVLKKNTLIEFIKRPFLELQS